MYTFRPTCCGVQTYSVTAIAMSEAGKSKNKSKGKKK